ncbi:hypothetical protein [Cellulosimicrobium cellulans]|uniref:hypothetical protein n=1 Tax=Cellulosimicrobium cellulans TaxID=1710 RepID=UPI001AD81A0D|nr:hypothetical protein [Cellulosimicrobium cellulans]
MLTRHPRGRGGRRRELGPQHGTRRQGALVERPQERVRLGPDGGLAVRDVVEQVRAAGEAVRDVGHALARGLGGLPRGAPGTGVEDGPLLERADDGAEAFERGGRPVRPGGRGVGRRAHLGGGPHVVVQHDGGRRRPARQAHRTGDPVGDPGHEEHDRDDEDRGERAAQVDRGCAVEEPEQPVDEPLQERRLRAVLGLRELLDEPPARLVGARLHGHVGRERPQRHAGGCAFAAVASSTSRPSRRMRTSM